MPFLALNVDPEAIANELHAMNEVLSRISNALDRIAPEIPAESNAPRMATLSDLRRTDTASISKVKAELDHYAQEHNVVVNSESFIESIQEFEKQVIESYGPEALNELPWNKAAGGPIFQGDANHKGEGNQRRTRSPFQSAAREASDTQPTAGTTGRTTG